MYFVRSQNSKHPYLYKNFRLNFTSKIVKSGNPILFNAKISLNFAFMNRLNSYSILHSCNA